MNRFDDLYRAWTRIPRAVRMPLVLMVGSSIVIAGIAMLALPGPGWAAIFIGFAVLASEFAFAEKVRDWLVSFLRNLMLYLKMRWNILTGKHKRK